MVSKVIRVVCLLFLFSVSLQASEAQKEVPYSNVIDEADLLSEADEEKVQRRIEDVIVSLELEPVIVLVNSIGNKSAMEYADDYFDYHGYGIGSDRQGILMLVNMGDRELWISTSGDQTIAKYQEHISAMVDYVTADLGDGNYYEAARTFLNYIESVESGEDVGNIRGVKGRSFLSYFVHPIILLISLVAGAIGVLVVTLSSKGKNTVTNRTYESSGGFLLAKQTDQFLRDTVIKTKIETSSSSGGSHQGSSGRSHGGGGGKF
ncbi:MAG: TPM domain-containing protein [Vallitaleaceae bacterium]|nr:TPM domain-containing protein [Vallitaleaceae bacterium]